MAELCACLSLVGLLQQDPTAKIDLNAVSSFPIVPQFDFDFSREHRVKLLAPPTPSTQSHEIDEDDFGEFETYEIKPPNEPGFIENSDKYRYGLLFDSGFALLLITYQTGLKNHY